ncbi:MAG TPA: hypothetical protein VGJ73_23165 [Verrucomicrobiae bacterium]|jgi:hypothetical protein
MLALKFSYEESEQFTAKSDARYRAASQSAARIWAALPRAALADSLALGYIYVAPLGL